MKKALIINAHQYYKDFAAGRLNQAMVDLAREFLREKGYEFQATKIEDGYDLKEEQEKHLWADVIITQTPIFWFGTPWIYKKYIDEVFTDALVRKILVNDDGRTRKDPSRQYGTGGKMQGKKFMLSTTWNAPREAFGSPEQILLNGKTEDDIFLPLVTVYKFCGAEIVPSFSCYDVLKNPAVESDMERYREHLKNYLA